MWRIGREQTGTATLKLAWHRETSETGFSGLGSARLSLGAVAELITGKINVVLSSKPFKDGSGDTKPSKTNLMNKT